MFEKIVEQIYVTGIVPVVVIHDAANAVPLAKALCRGGICTAEVTFRTTAAKDAIALMAEQVPEILVGAGTVTSVELAELAVEAGAKYIVSPGFNPKVVAWCVEQGVPIFPGVSTPSEVEAAMEFGLTTLKFFPAEPSGGRAMLSALASPYGNLRFMPTGGIGAENLNDYLSLPNVVACGGSWICPTDYISHGRFDEIEALCKEAVVKMHGFSLLHVGLNSANSDKACADANLFSEMFSLTTREFSGAYFAGDIMEVVKTPFLGEHGHIAIGTNNIDRAIAYFEKRGYPFRSEGLAEDNKGIIAAYLQQEVGGFAIHLRRK